MTISGGAARPRRVCASAALANRVNALARAQNNAKEFLKHMPMIKSFHM
jgi:hypothetical protein